MNQTAKWKVKPVSRLYIFEISFATERTQYKFSA